MTESIDVTDQSTLSAAYRLAGGYGYIDMTTWPPSAVLSTRTQQRARYGDTVTRHDDGTVTVTKTIDQGALW